MPATIRWCNNGFVLGSILPNSRRRQTASKVGDDQRDSCNINSLHHRFRFAIFILIGCAISLSETFVALFHPCFDRGRSIRKRVANIGNATAHPHTSFGYSPIVQCADSVTARAFKFPIRIQRLMRGVFSINPNKPTTFRRLRKIIKVFPPKYGELYFLTFENAEPPGSIKPVKTHTILP